MTWQPIETAPKDGTRVLLANRRYRFVDAGHYWRNANKRHPRKRWVWNGWPRHEPTHWQPLPAPPKTGE
jgi:hypothetical protein